MIKFFLPVTLLVRHFPRPPRPAPPITLTDDSQTNHQERRADDLLPCAGEFDMRVKSCSANAENSQPIQLSDEHGCVLRPKMISKFMKIAGADTRASVVTYAFFHAFKFPDSMAVNIKCKVGRNTL